MFKPASYLFIIYAQKLFPLIVYFSKFLFFPFFISITASTSTLALFIQGLFSFFFFGELSQHLLSERIVADDSAFCKLDNDIASRGYTHVDEAEGLRDAVPIKEEWEVLVLSLHVLGHLVLDPLKGDALLIDSLKEDLIWAIHLEE